MSVELDTFSKPRNPMMAADSQVEGGSTSGDEDGSEELVPAGGHQPALVAQVSSGGDKDEDGQDELDTNNNQSLVPSVWG